MSQHDGQGGNEYADLVYKKGQDRRRLKKIAAELLEGHDYSEARKILQRMLLLSEESDIKLDMLFQIAECDLMVDRRISPNTDENIMELLKSSGRSFHELGGVAEDRNNSASAIMHMYTCRLLRRQEREPNKAVKDIADCMRKVQNEIGEMIEKRNLKSQAHKTVPLMTEMLKELRLVVGAADDFKVASEAACLNKTGMVYIDVARRKEATQCLSEGRKLMEDHFGSNASKYSIYAAMANNMGYNFAQQMEFNNAALYHEKAIHEVPFAVDIGEKERMESLDNYEKGRENDLEHASRFQSYHFGETPDLSGSNKSAVFEAAETARPKVSSMKGQDTELAPEKSTTGGTPQSMPYRDSAEYSSEGKATRESSQAMKNSDREEKKNRNPGITVEAGGKYVIGENIKAMNVTRGRDTNLKMDSKDGTNIVIDKRADADVDKHKTNSNAAQGFMDVGGGILIDHTRPLRPGVPVYQGKFNGEDVAVKRIEFSDDHLKEVEERMKMKPHPNVVTYKHCAKWESRETPGLVYIYIAMELCGPNNLADMIENKKLSSEERLSALRQLMSALHHIHESNFIHGDLKPRNVLMSLDGKFMKICDYGITRRFPEGKTQQTLSSEDLGGTIRWEVPDEKLSKESDVYSAGLVFYYVLSEGNRDPMDPKNIDASRLSCSHAEEAKDFVMQMLKHDRKLRPNASDALNQPFIWGEEKKLQLLCDFGHSAARCEESSKRQFAMSNYDTAQKMFLDLLDSVNNHTRLEALLYIATCDVMLNCSIGNGTNTEIMTALQTLGTSWHGLLKMFSTEQTTVTILQKYYACKLLAELSQSHEGSDDALKETKRLIMESLTAVDAMISSGANQEAKKMLSLIHDVVKDIEKTTSTVTATHVIATCLVKISSICLRLSMYRDAESLLSEARTRIEKAFGEKASHYTIYSQIAGTLANTHAIQAKYFHATVNYAEAYHNLHSAEEKTVQSYREKYLKTYEKGFHENFNRLTVDERELVKRKVCLQGLADCERADPANTVGLESDDGGNKNKDTDYGGERDVESIVICKGGTLEKRTFITASIVAQNGASLEMIRENTVTRVDSQTHNHKKKSTSSPSKNGESRDGPLFHVGAGIFVDHSQQLRAGRHVFKGRFQDKEVAVKRVEFSEKRNLEVEIMKRLRHHPNIVRYRASTVWTSAEIPGLKFMYIAMELCDTWTLYELAKDESYSKRERIMALDDFIKGLHYIHSNDVIHGDLKPLNVLRSLDKKSVKIADFGISKKLDKTSHNPPLKSGTFRWFAPEMKVSKESDIYSAGLIFYYVLSGGTQISSQNAFGKLVISGLSPWDAIMARELVSQMIDLDPTRRPTTEEMSKSIVLG